MSDFDILYPPKQRQNFDGGLNNKYDRHLIEDNESPECQNVIFDRGTVETRLGVAKLNSSSVGTFVGHGLYTRHTNDGNQTMVAWFNGTAYTYAANTFTTIPSAQSIYTAGVRVCAAEYENYIFFNNGNNDGYKYNGAFTYHKVPTQASAATVDSGGTGVLCAGVGYTYKVTNVNSNLVESDVGPVTTTFVVTTSTDCQLVISDIQVISAIGGVNRRRLYRSNSGSTYLRVTELADNTTTSFTDNVAETALGLEAPSDQAGPPQYSAIITHQNRLFCNDTGNPSLYWYSELGNPYVFKATNFEEVGDNSGDVIKGFGIHDNALVIMCDQNTYLTFMPTTDPTGWRTVKLKSPYGTRSPYGGFNYNNKFMFPAVQNDQMVGFAAIMGDAVAPDASLLANKDIAGSDLKSDRIEPDIYEFQSVGLKNLSSMVYRNKAYITVTYGNGETTNNRIYVYDFSIANLSKNQEASWVPWTGLNAQQFTVLDGKLYYQTSDTTGFVYEMNKASTYSDDGVAIDSYFWTKEFYGIPGDEQNIKDWRYFNILYDKPGNYYMDVNYKVDSDNGDGNRIQIDLTPGSSVWGTMVFGIDDWGGGAAYGEDRVYFGQLRGKRVQLRFSNQNTINQKFKVAGLQLSYNRKGRR